MVMLTLVTCNSQLISFSKELIVPTAGGTKYFSIRILVILIIIISVNEIIYSALLLIQECYLFSFLIQRRFIHVTVSLNSIYYSFAQGENMVSTFGLFKFQVINLVSKINRLYLEDMIIHYSLLSASLGTLINSCSPISRSFTI
jgi:hypothetical protein